MSRSSLFAFCAAALVACGPLEQLPEPPALGRVVVANESPQALASLFVSSQSQADWGHDLVAGTLASGATLELSPVPAGAYDLMAVGLDGRLSYAWGFAVGPGATTRVTVR